MPCATLLLTAYMYLDGIDDIVFLALHADAVDLVILVVILVYWEVVVKSSSTSVSSDIRLMKPWTSF